MTSGYFITSIFTRKQLSEEQVIDSLNDAFSDVRQHEAEETIDEERILTGNSFKQIGSRNIQDMDMHGIDIKYSEAPPTDVGEELLSDMERSNSGMAFCSQISKDKTYDPRSVFICSGSGGNGDGSQGDILMATTDQMTDKHISRLDEFEGNKMERTLNNSRDYEVLGGETAKKILENPLSQTTGKHVMDKASSNADFEINIVGRNTNQSANGNSNDDISSQEKKTEDDGTESTDQQAQASSIASTKETETESIVHARSQQLGKSTPAKKRKTNRVTFKSLDTDSEELEDDDSIEDGTDGGCMAGGGGIQNMLFDNDSTSEDSIEKISPSDLAYGNDGYKHYKLYAEIDKKIRVDEMEDAKEALRLKYDWRIEQIEDIVNVAREYYKNPKNSKAASEWNELKETVSLDKRSTVKSNTDIRFHLSSLHEHRTIFTYILIAMQLVVVIVVCAFGKVTFVGLEPKLELMAGVKTYMGTEMVHKWIPPNVWIGPSERYLISVGALYAPCMREDFSILIDIIKDGYSKDAKLGCCEVASRNVAGTTSRVECVNATNGVGAWKDGIWCSERPSGQNFVAHILKPCCTGLRGRCQLLSHEHCQFLGGQFHISGPEHCSQVNCLSYVCGMGGLTPDPDRPWLPLDPIQWWRLPLSLVYHHGIIHALLVSVGQFLLFRKIERTLGWLRLIIVYLVTGLGGLLTAALFSPFTPHGGGTATVFGMAGLITAELVHYWHLVQKPAVELIKICGILTVFLVTGTLPYIDNYSIVSGFLLGLFCAILFLPFMAFKREQKHCRFILLGFIVPLIFLVYFVLFYAFYKVQTFEECTVCNMFNCVPYTETMCDSSLWVDEGH